MTPQRRGETVDRHPKRMRKSVPAVAVALGLALIGCSKAAPDSSDASANRPSDASSSDQPGNSPSGSPSGDQPGNSPSGSPSGDQPGNSPSGSPSGGQPPLMSPPTMSPSPAPPPGANQAPARAPAPTGKNRIGGNGIYRVGADIEPGTYHSPGPSGSACYWARLDAQDEILDNGLSQGPSVVNVQPTDAAVETANCQPFTKG
jgi:hypothetical protein